MGVEHLARPAPDLAPAPTAGTSSPKSPVRRQILRPPLETPTLALAGVLTISTLDSFLPSARALPIDPRPVLGRGVTRALPGPRGGPSARRWSVLG
jgi:hypothetical protein